MRKLLFFTAILLLTTACHKSELIIYFPNPPDVNEGVVINGIRWATHNVAAPGEFTERPEDVGMFFQWNRRVGWEWRDVDDELVLINSNEGTNWTAGNPAGTDWVVGNDPCPVGWRVPTLAELMSLRDAGGSWGTKNGVPGRLFGSASDGIFLPAAGWLSNGTDNNRGRHYDDGKLGFYWSRTTSGNNQARNLTFSNEIAGVRTNARTHGYSIRCVREYVTGVTLNRTAVVLSVGETESLVAAIEPANATNRNVTWESNNPAVATVNANGVVTAVSLGEATITVTTADGGRTANSTVTVIETCLDGVVINGTRWATRNVGAPGTFADSPRDVGMFFQWNRRVGWSATNPPINSNDGTTWNPTVPTGTTWESQNDPCPDGWRVPTAEELDALNVDGGIWATYSGVNGRLFGGVIFLPAAGWLNGGSGGALSNEGTHGFYWSSAIDGNNQAQYLTFNNSTSEMRNTARVHGFSIRCVAE